MMDLQLKWKSLFPLSVSTLITFILSPTCWSGPGDVKGGCYDNQESQQDGQDTEDSERAEGQNPENARSGVGLLFKSPAN